MMVTAVFAATEIAQAADISFSGQIRTRYEINEQSDFSNATEADDFTSTRVRLNSDIKVNDSTSAHIELESVEVWGGAGESVGSNIGTGQGSGTSSDTSVGLHQAYFTLKNFATLPVDLKVGRQEVVLDGHRLFGSTNWAQGAQHHDAIRLTHAHDNMTFVYAWIALTEDGSPTGGNLDDQNDVEAHLAYFQYAGILGGNFSAVYAYLQDGCAATSATACGNLENDVHTVGARQAGQLYGIDYRGEFYYQFGDATAVATNSTRGGFTAGTDVDRDAYMFGVRVGKAFNNVMMKPSLTVWYDYLSGTSDNDLAGANGDWKSFNTLFDTGHKFYGFMDQYTGVGGGSAGSGTNGLGLQDIAIKAKLAPMPGWTLKADYHWFYTAEGVSGSPSVNGIGHNEGNSLGNELDVTLINKYNANTNISIGYSNYTTSAAFRDIRTQGGDDANWAYVMFDVKF